MTAINYPQPPAGVDEKIMDPSPAFRGQMVKVLAAIMFFLVFYLVLFVAAVSLACLCAWMGVALMGSYISFYTIIIGLGLIGIGIMVVYFLLKFLFKSNKIDRSSFIEVTETDQPVLFDFIRKVSDETQAPFPKKVYLYGEVNASVFYDSSFLSMFLPVKKNLLIGLGLVNVVNITEFKAIMAHEFGHFSQRSMKFGSYVYYVNNIIHNMLYDNDDYSKALGQWASIHSYFRAFVMLTIKIVTGIQYLLKQVYGVVNSAYSKLSIEMEFHADSVSAFVTGSDHLVTSLKKMQVGQMCYGSVLNYCNQNIGQNLRSDNFYSQQKVVIRQFADKFNIPLQDDALQLSDNKMDFLNRYRVTVKDRWASHPSDTDREAKLKALNIVTPAIADSAWGLFANAEQLQQEITLKAYETVSFKNTPEVLDTESFTARYFKEIEDNNFDKAYKGYYDGRDIERFEIDDVLSVAYTQTDNFDELFNDTNCGLPGKINNLKTDIEGLKVIADRKNKIRSFNFDGISTDYRDAPAIQQQLEDELAIAQQQLKDRNKLVFSFFYHRATGENKLKLKEGYTAMFDATEECAKDMTLYKNAMAAMEPVYGQRKFTEIRLTMQDVKAAENQIIPRIKHLVDNVVAYGLTDEQTTALNDYLNHTRIYFMQPNFDNKAIGVFNKAMTTFAGAVIDKAFKTKKNLYSFQLNL